MSTEHAAPRLPDIVLERYRLGELPAGQSERVADLIQRDEETRHRLDGLERSDEALRRDGSIDRVVSSLRDHVQSRVAPSRSRSAWFAPLPAAATVALVLGIGVALVLNRPATIDGDRIKGLPPSLTVYRQTERGSEQLADGAVAHRGDLVRLGYRAAGHTYGAIVSVDGRGTLTQHLPATGDRAVPLEQSSSALLDRAFELDDAPAFERFYFVVGDSSFELAPVLDALRKAQKDGAPSLPRGLEHFTFYLKKEITR
jgi:hypothetical protein